MSSSQATSATKTVIAQGVIKSLNKGAKKTTHSVAPKVHRNRFLDFKCEKSEATTKWIRVETPMASPDFQEAAGRMVEAVPGSRMTRVETTSITKMYRYREPETRLSTTGIFEIPLDVILNDLREFYPEAEIAEIQFTPFQ